MDDRGRFARRLQSSHPAMTASDRRWILFELPPLRPTAPAPVSGAQVRPIAVRASLNDDLAWRAADGRVETGWYTDIQRPGHTLTLDFGRLVSGTALRLEQGGRPLDYPRLLEIDRSGDGLMWSRAWGRAGGALAWQAAIESPRTMPLTIPLDGCPGRYLRLRLVAESPTQRWSVAEVSMFEPAPTGARMVAGTICRP